MRLSLKYKMIGLVLFAALMPTLGILAFTAVRKDQVSDTVIEEMDVLARGNVSQIALDVYGMCETANDLVQQQVDNSLNVARDVLFRRGGVRASAETVSWQATNQFTKETVPVSLPRMLAGDAWLGQNRNLAEFTPVVDEVKQLVGGTCTIFQRMNEQGDMLRVATNVEKLDNTRAIGTYIPAMNPDGSPNPVIAAVMAGETYQGRAFVVNAWYLTAYEPLKNSRGELVGVLYVGIKQEAVESLRQAIMSVKVGTTGYVFILGGKGDQKGHYIISKGGARDGENILEAKDSDGRLFIQSIVDKGTVLSKGQVDFERYPWKNKGESAARMKIAALAYFEPWDWVIGASTYEDDYLTAQKKVDAALGSLLMWSLGGGLLVLAIAVGVAVVVSGRIARPVRLMAERAEQLRGVDIANLGKATEAMARGDLNVRVEIGTSKLDIDSRDEMGSLAKSFNSIIEQTQATVGSFEQALSVLRQIVAQTQQLIQAARKGQLDQRGEADRFQGGYRDLVQGINAMLDAVATPIDQAAQVLEQVADRDLTARMDGQYEGDFARIQASLNLAVENLDQGLSQVAMSASQVDSASGQISSGSQSLAQGASEQASSLEEISSSLAEVGSMSRQSAANAQQARGMTDQTRTTAQQGVESMQRLSAAIEKIKDSSDETAQIVKTIDEIAFQTNLLALNAAVEAARAGEAGKGFAVVAEEVRSLAQRSAEAAKTTSRLISESVDNAESGVSLNAEVLKNLESIHGQVEKVSVVMGEIAEGSEQQREGIDQINSGVEQLNQVTQQNAANAEESASAAEELSSQAAEMQSLVGSFQLNRRQSAASGAKRAAPPMRNKEQKRKNNGIGKMADPEELIPFDEEDEALLKSF